MEIDRDRLWGSIVEIDSGGDWQGLLWESIVKISSGWGYIVGVDSGIRWQGSIMEPIMEIDRKGRY